MSVVGECTEQFDTVREAFQRNFDERDEVGASACLMLDGETVVDLWGGIADSTTNRPWDRDTIGVVWSNTKGAAALCAHVLVARGQLDLDAPVASLWPEFAKAGKEAITVRMALAHQAGLAGFSQPVPEDAYCEWELITDLLARQEPLWEPGTRHGYHAFTFGHLVGEIVRRVSGLSLGTFFHDEIATPYGLDFHIGLAAEHEGRVAPTIPAPFPEPGDPLPSFYSTALSDPGSIAAKVVMHSGALLTPGWIDSRVAHAAEIPACNGIANARALAGMYRPLSLGGEDLVDGPTLDAMSAVTSATSVDATMLVPTRFALGFVKSIDNTRQGPGDQDGVVLSEAAFGHVGMGGSLGFADPDARIAFGYTMNRQGMTTGLDARGQSLVDAVYSSLGYSRSSRGGSWYGPNLRD